MIDLDFNPVDAGQWRSQRKQSREGRLINEHALIENEVIGCHRLNQPALAGRDSVPIKPSGAPVEKEKELADARGGSDRSADKLKQMARIEAGLSRGMR